MLDRFGALALNESDARPCLVQGDGSALPFRDRSFSAIMLAHVLSASRQWRELLSEGRRVLEANGVLFLVQRAGPTDGVDARMRQRLGEILASMRVDMPAAGRVKTEARQFLAAVAKSHQHIAAARWPVESSPRGFLERHATGVRFAELPREIQDESTGRLSEWAMVTFGSLDANVREEHRLEMDAFWL